MFSILVFKAAKHKGNLSKICLHTCQVHLHPALQEKRVASLLEYMACPRRALLLHIKAETTERWTALSWWGWGKTEHSLLSSTACTPLWVRQGSQMRQWDVPFHSFLGTLVRKCEGFVFPSHPLFLRAQHRGFLPPPVQFFKSATSSAAYTGRDLLEEVWAIAQPYPGRGKAVCWPCGMWPCPSVWDVFSAPAAQPGSIWVHCWECSHPALPKKRCGTSNTALTWAFQPAGLHEHPFWQLSPVLLSFLLGQLPVSALGPLNYLSSTTWHRTSGSQDGLACEWLVLPFRMQFNLHCKGSSVSTDLGTCTFCFRHIWHFGIVKLARCCCWPNVVSE